MWFSLDGRTALVTGSVRGLGLEMARGLAQAGARVVLNGRDQATLNRAATQLRADGLDIDARAFDVTDHDAARDLGEGRGGRGSIHPRARAPNRSSSRTVSPE
jgi:gluconate 5-dehydrogenase